ncbi:hypothetical protein RIF29_09917 [Crotalaria pallida]|uniref:Uncharacterized protein n=1 Tax=Crotalaria pallida TaxID=3830 RepID=A0AAN9FZT7_CROPI
MGKQEFGPLVVGHFSPFLDSVMIIAFLRILCGRKERSQGALFLSFGCNCHDYACSYLACLCSVANLFDLTGLSLKIQVDELPLVEIELKKANCREKALKARDLKMSLEFIQKLLKEATTLQIEKEKQFVNLSCVLAVALPWEERAREILSHEAPISDFEDMIRAAYSDMVLTSMRFQNFKHLVLHCNGAEELFLSAIILLHWRISCICPVVQVLLISLSGELRSTLNRHKGPIFSLKWNKKGDYLLTGSFDGAALDVDWRNNVSFATSSSDNMIYVCKIGENRPIKVFAGHQGEVNCVKWDPSGSVLATCSDDKTVKIWNMKHDKFLHDFREHSKEIYTIRWSPTGPGSSNPNKKLLLASASFDSTVKLWDVELGRSLYSFNKHRDSIYSVAFSPNGEYLASGSLDKSIYIWSLKDGTIVKQYTGSGGIFEVCWNKEGDKLAACFKVYSINGLDLSLNLLQTGSIGIYCEFGVTPFTVELNFFPPIFRPVRFLFQSAMCLSLRSPLASPVHWSMEIYYDRK